MRYLIHSGPGIGDIIQFLSMARAIKDVHPDSIVDIIMRGSNQTSELDNQILECQDYVDNLYWYSSGEVMHDAKLILLLRNNKYDFGIVRIGAVTEKTSYWIYRIMKIAGCKTIVGSGTDKVDVKVDIPQGTHYLKRNALLLKALGVSGRENALSINKSKLDADWLNKLKIPEGVKVVGLSLGTNPMVWKENGRDIIYDVKSWPMNRWAELSKQLTEEGCYVLLIGGSKERKEIEEKNVIFPREENIIDLVGKTSIKQSLTAINRCSLMVGAEGGMMHCASALGIKTLTIFGGSDYRVWNPGGEDSPIINLNYNCAPCFCTKEGAHCTHHDCLMKIDTKLVFDDIMSIIY